MPLLVFKIVDVQPVIAEHGVSKEHHTFVSPCEARSDRGGLLGSVIAGVRAEVRFQSPVRGEVISTARATANEPCLSSVVR